MDENGTEILLVEDEPAHADLVRRAFARRNGGGRLAVATSLKEARYLLTQSPPDLMIVDLLLPDGVGTELIPPRESEFQFPVVLMTSHGNEQVAVETIKAGVLDYVIKSATTLAEMPRIADRALRQWEQRVARKRAEERYEDLVQNETHIIYTLDAQGLITFANPAVRTVLAYDPDELIGKHFMVLIPEEVQEETGADFRRLLRTGEIAAQTILLDRHGQRHFVEYHSTVIREGGEVVGTRGIVRDVSERKRVEEELARHREHLEDLVEERTAELAKANVQLLQEIAERNRTEEALRESERRSRAIFDQTFQFIGLMTPDGTLVEANRSALSFAGVDATEVLGKPFWETPWWTHSSELQAQLREAVRRAAAGEFIRFEATHPAADGSLHDVDFSLKPVRDEAGDVTLLIPEGRDITEYKRMEQKRKRAEAALQKEQHLLRELLNLQEQERRLVAYEIHDGLAQQLAGAQMAFQAFDQLLKDDPEEARKVFQRGLRNLGDSLHEARRLISGLRPPILDESGIVHAVEYLISELEQRHGMNVDFAHDVSFGRLASPLETAVFRIAQESLNNAARHSQSDKVHVELREKGGHVELVVRDSGVGFHPGEVAENHFGLRGIRERARLFGGRAMVDAAPGRGTCVSVELPILRKSREEPRPTLV
jgi:PAS domain S-box-containing protein